MDKHRIQFYRLSCTQRFPFFLSTSSENTTVTLAFFNEWKLRKAIEVQFSRVRSFTEKLLCNDFAIFIYIDKPILVITNLICTYIFTWHCSNDCWLCQLLTHVISWNKLKKKYFVSFFTSFLSLIALCKRFISHWNRYFTMLMQICFRR